MRKWHRAPLILTIKVMQRFFNDGCMYYASALTFTTLLAIVPLMLVSVSVLAIFPVFAHWGGSIQDFIFNNFVPNSGQVLQTYLLTFVKQAGQLSILGFALLLITAVLLLFNIEQAFNIIWRVNRQRKGLVAFLMYWAIITLAPLLMGLSLAITSYIISLPLIATTAEKLHLIQYSLSLLPFLLAIFAFTILYVAIPNCRVPTRYALASGILAGLLFEIAKYGFAFYLKSFNTYQIIYGALGAIPLFLLWIYLSWIIILFGAEVCHALTYRLSYYEPVTLDPFTHAYLWLGHLWQAQKQQKSLSLADLVRLDDAGYQIDPEHQMQILCETHLVQRVSGGNYVLGTDLHQLDFMSLAATLPWKLPTSIPNEKNNPWLTKLQQQLEKAQQVYLKHNSSLVDYYEE